MVRAFVLYGRAASEQLKQRSRLTAVVVGIVVFALILRSEDTARRIGGWADAVIGWVFGLFKRDEVPDATAGIVQFRDSIVDVVKDRWVLITVANLGQQLAQFTILYLAVVALQGSWTQPIGVLEALVAQLDDVAVRPAPRWLARVWGSDISAMTVRTTIERESRIVRVESRAAHGDDAWRLHARGTIRRAPARQSWVHRPQPLHSDGLMVLA